MGKSNAQVVRIAVADGIELAADVAGPADGPPALLLHGMGQTRQSWTRAAAALATQGWRTIAVDSRGHGDSDWVADDQPDTGYELADFAGDVTALCDWIGEAPLVIGASLGGMSSLLAQADAGDTQRFLGVVLVDIAPDVDMKGGRRIMRFMAGRPDGFADLDDAADYIGAYRDGRGAPSPDGLRRVLRQRADGRWNWHWDQRILANRLKWIDDEQLAAAYQERLREFTSAGARHITVPTLLVRGGSSDVVTPEGARRLLDSIPHAQFVDVADASHMVAGDRNDLFTAAVLDFAEPLLPALRDRNP